jgi:hypothetical protein
MERALPLEELASAGLERRSRFDFTLDVLLSYPTPNYENPVTRGPELYILNSIFFAVMLFCVAVRLYSRVFIRRWFGWDDCFLVLAVVGRRSRKTFHNANGLCLDWRNGCDCLCDARNKEVCVGSPYL